jgi:hypothetical protein
MLKEVIKEVLGGTLKITLQAHPLAGNQQILGN